jgi:hypothetical protein
VEWLQHKWGEFQELYEKGPERIKLLNKVAPNFFHIVNKLLFEDAMLHMCRLTERSTTMGHKNITLMTLAESIVDQGFSAQVGKEIDNIKKKCEFARMWRDKRLAHTDMKSLRNEHVLPLPSVTSKNIEDAVESMRTMVSSVEQHYGIPRSVLAHDPFGGRSLVHYLEKAVRAEENENQCWRELGGRA